MGKSKIIVFGPVPSRRLGRSLGINNIPPKRCTYSCVYCQLGRTEELVLERQEFYSPQKIFMEVQNKLRELQSSGEKTDYLTFVADGEPTLDINLGQEINLLASLGKKIAVITNGSLLWCADVKDDLEHVSWVSLKIDSVWQNVWEKINRPHEKLDLKEILKGEAEFARSFKGELTTETMLVRGINDNKEHIMEIAKFIAGLNPSVSYLAIPTRPPAEKWVQPTDERNINLAYHIFKEKLKRVELLVSYEGDEFTNTSDIRNDLLNITSVHPMREDAVLNFLRRKKMGREVISELINRGLLIELEYQGMKYYLRRFREN